MTQTIKLSTPTNERSLLTSSSAQQYLDVVEKNAAGKHFQIVVEQYSWDNVLAGMEYSNCLFIKAVIDGEWKVVYSTGKLIYRGSTAEEVDDKDLQLEDPHIVSESASEQVYSLMTGAGKIMTYRFVNEGEKPVPERIGVFDYAEMLKREKANTLVTSTVDDANAYLTYVKSGFEKRWYTASDLKSSGENAKIFDEGNIVVLLAQHSDRDYDAVTDRYQVHIWVKGRGRWVSSSRTTALRHPIHRFYHVPVWLTAELVSRDENQIKINVGVHNNSQNRHFEEEYIIDLSE